MNHSGSTFKCVAVAASLALWISGMAAAQFKPLESIASDIMRMARARLGSEPLTIHTVDAATLLVQEALDFDPQNLDSWHAAMHVAMMTDNETLKARALERIAALDPADETVRLLRINAALDRFQTFEERAAAYNRLLSDASVAKIGRPVASRLALDLALLHQRQGSIDDFTRWLSKAVEWDSSNRSAAAMATGFFSLNVNDPVAQSELLVNLMLADPTDTGTQVELAERCLVHGAYAAADRLYRMAIKGMTVNGQTLPQSLLIDQITAMWGIGANDHALNLLMWRQQAIDAEHKFFVAREMPHITPEQLREVTGPIEPELALMQSAIRVSRRDADAEKAVERTIAGYQALIDIAREMQNLPESERRGAQFQPIVVAQHYLDMAWAALWFGHRIDDVPTWVAAASDLSTIPDWIRARFDGWLQLRTGNPAQAIELMAPYAKDDIASRMGIAHALEAQGKLRDAAREFLGIHRDKPGSVMGIWSLLAVQRILQQPVPPSPTAVALDRLIGSIPQQFDRAVQDTTFMLQLRIVPAKLTYQPYEPIIVSIELTNRSHIPLAIDRNGPIRPHLLMHCSVRGVGSGGSADVRPFVLDLGRRLRLGPRETMTFQVNLREYWPGQALQNLALVGSIIKIRAVLNFRLSPNGRGEPGLYGLDVESPILRVDGIRITDEWALERAQHFRDGVAVPLAEMAVLGHALAPRPRQMLDADGRQKLQSSRAALTDGFAALDPVSQAWLMTAFPRGVGLLVEGMQPIYGLARQSEHRLVQLCYLLFQTTNIRDPAFEAAKNSGDQTLRTLAEAMEADAMEAEADADRSSQNQN